MIIAPYDSNWPDQGNGQLPLDASSPYWAGDAPRCYAGTEATSSFVTSE